MANKLTSKQELYVQGLVSGLSQRKAYINAGYSTKGKSDDYIDQQASKLFANTKVLARYNEIMEEHKDKALWTREDAIETLKWLLDQSVSSVKDFDAGYVRKSTADAIISSIQELNKLEDLYNLNRDLNRVKQELEIKKLEQQLKENESQTSTDNITIVDTWTDDGDDDDSN